MPQTIEDGEKLIKTNRVNLAFWYSDNLIFSTLRIHIYTYLSYKIVISVFDI